MIASLILAILATYRLARLLPEDDGPFFIFRYIRTFTANKAMAENDEWGFWQMIDEGVNCPYCVGLYSAIIVGLLVIWNNYYGNAFILIMAIAGGQSFLQRLKS